MRLGGGIQPQAITGVFLSGRWRASSNNDINLYVVSLSSMVSMLMFFSFVSSTQIYLQTLDLNSQRLQRDAVFSPLFQMPQNRSHSWLPTPQPLVLFNSSLVRSSGRQAEITQFASYPLLTSAFHRLHHNMDFISEQLAYLCRLLDLTTLIIISDLECYRNN